MGSPEAYDESDDFDDWLRPLLSYLSLNNHRYKIIAQHYLEYCPETHTRDQLALFYDADFYIENITLGADYLAIVLINVLL